jgi:hypothetical protein
MEGRELHPVTNRRGVHLFDEQAVQNLPPRKASQQKKVTAKFTDGEIAADCFRAFSHGYSLREIVDKLQVTPQVVVNLYAFWSDNNLRVVLDQRQRAKLRTSGAY